MIKQAVILAGGKGTRLRPLTYKTPKPMILINGKPFLEYIILHLKKSGIQEIILLVGYLHQQIEEYFGTGKKYGLSIKYSYSSPETATGTRIKNSLPLIKDYSLLLYADNYWTGSIKKLLSYSTKKRKKLTMTVYKNADKYSKNNVRVQNGLIKIYDAKRQAKNLNGVNIGFYVVNKKTLLSLPSQGNSFEELFDTLIKQEELAAFYTSKKYYGLSNLERISAIQKFFGKQKL